VSGALLSIAAVFAWAPSATAGDAMTDAAGAAASIAACSERYATVSRIATPEGMPAATAIRAALQPTRVWDLAWNARISPDPAATRSWRCAFPRAPSHRRATFRAVAPASSLAPARRAASKGACLSDRLRSSAGFAFARGGKLTGLHGGNGPVDGAVADTGFSARLVWRRNGDGDLTAKFPGSEALHGRSVGHGHSRFPSGRRVVVEDEFVPTIRPWPTASPGTGSAARIARRRMVRRSGAIRGCRSRT
jgi:hypothetical protein